MLSSIYAFQLFGFLCDATEESATFFYSYASTFSFWRCFIHSLNIHLCISLDRKYKIENKLGPNWVTLGLGLMHRRLSPVQHIHVLLSQSCPFSNPRSFPFR